MTTERLPHPIGLIEGMQQVSTNLLEVHSWNFLAYRFTHESLDGMLFIWEEVEVL